MTTTSQCSDSNQRRNSTRLCVNVSNRRISLRGRCPAAPTSRQATTELLWTSNPHTRSTIASMSPPKGVKAIGADGANKLPRVLAKIGGDKRWYLQRRGSVCRAGSNPPQFCDLNNRFLLVSLSRSLARPFFIYRWWASPVAARICRLEVDVLRRPDVLRVEGEPQHDLHGQGHHDPEQVGDDEEAHETHSIVNILFEPLERRRSCR